MSRCVNSFWQLGERWSYGAGVNHVEKKGIAKSYELAPTLVYTLLSRKMEEGVTLESSTPEIPLPHNSCLFHINKKRWTCRGWNTKSVYVYRIHQCKEVWPKSEDIFCFLTRPVLPLLTSTPSKSVYIRTYIKESIYWSIGKSKRYILIELKYGWEFLLNSLPVSVVNLLMSYLLKLY